MSPVLQVDSFPSEPPGKPLDSERKSKMNLKPKSQFLIQTLASLVKEIRLMTSTDRILPMYTLYFLESFCMGRAGPGA